MIVCEAMEQFKNTNNLAALCVCDATTDEIMEDFDEATMMNRRVYRIITENNTMYIFI